MLSGARLLPVSSQPEAYTVCRQLCPRLARSAAGRFTHELEALCGSGPLEGAGAFAKLQRHGFVQAETLQALRPQHMIEMGLLMGHALYLDALIFQLPTSPVVLSKRAGEVEVDLVDGFEVKSGAVPAPGQPPDSRSTPNRPAAGSEPLTPKPRPERSGAIDVSRFASERSNSGYRGVTRTLAGRYQAQISIDGERVYIGQYETALEAAQACAQRRQAVSGAMALDQGTSNRPAPTKRPAQAKRPGQRKRIAELSVADLRDFESSQSNSGYFGVSLMQANGKYQASLWIDGKRIKYGCKATAEEAALVVAKAYLEQHGEPPQDRHWQVHRNAPQRQLSLAI